MDLILPKATKLLSRFYREHAAVVAWFASRPAADGSLTPRVATRLTGNPADYPQVRITRVGGSPDLWADRPRLQVECWADTEGDAEDLALLLLAASGDLPDTVYSDGWIKDWRKVLDPVWSPGEGSPGRPRFLFDLELYSFAIVP